MRNHTCLSGCSRGLAGVCGSSIDVDDLDFAPSRNHLLYVDKVFSKGEGTACPIVFNIRTNTNTFQTQLLMSPLHVGREDLCEQIFGDCCWNRQHDRGCGCNSKCNNNCNNNWNCNNNCNSCCNCNNDTSCILDETAVFTVMKSFVNVRTFDTSTTCSINGSQVTIDGVPVDSLSCQSGAYEAVIRQRIPQIVKEPCIERGLPTKTFFLITGAGPWSYEAEFVLEGTVTTGGRTCCFKATFATNARTPIPASISNLSVPKLSIPCISGGIAPRLFFAFDGKINLLNPAINVIDEGGVLRLVLVSSAVAEPTVDVEVVKKSLFCINGCEAIFPCQGTTAFTESQMDDDDDDSLCEPDCHCGRRGNECGCGESCCQSDRGCERSACERIADENTNCGNTIAMGTNSSCSSCCKGF